MVVRPPGLAGPSVIPIDSGKEGSHDAGGDRHIGNVEEEQAGPVLGRDGVFLGGMIAERVARGCAEGTGGG